MLWLILLLLIIIVAISLYIRTTKRIYGGNDIIHTSKQHISEISALINGFITQMGKPEVPEGIIRETELNKPYSFVKTMNNRVCGFINAIQENDVLRIENVIIHPDYRGRGIASELIEFILNLKIANITELEVSKRNPYFDAVKRLYEKHGFKQIKENEKHITMRIIRS